jgi:hypothetical protein
VNLSLIICKQRTNNGAVRSLRQATPTSPLTEIAVEVIDAPQSAVTQPKRKRRWNDGNCQGLAGGVG